MQKSGEQQPSFISIINYAYVCNKHLNIIGFIFYNITFCTGRTVISELSVRFQILLSNLVDFSYFPVMESAHNECDNNTMSSILWIVAYIFALKSVCCLAVITYESIGAKIMLININVSDM